MTTPRKFLIAFGFLLSFVLIIGIFLPGKYIVSRSIDIYANPAEIDPYVSNLRQWENWSPWKQESPSLVVRYGEKTQGPGAQKSWTGAAGKGSIKVTNVSPNRWIAFDLTFDEPSHQAKSLIIFNEKNLATQVVWKMSGVVHKPIFAGFEAFAIESTMRDTFQRGLRNLKEFVEGDNQG